MQEFPSGISQSNLQPFFEAAFLACWFIFGLFLGILRLGRTQEVGGKAHNENARAYIALFCMLAPSLEFFGPNSGFLQCGC
jgi:hypothetical protein